MRLARHPIVLGLANSRRTYVFGEVRVAMLALLTFTALSGRRSSGVVITKFSGHAVTFRSSPTVCADTPRFWSASTRILSGKPPRAMRSAAVLLGLYRIRAPLTARYQPSTFLRGGRQAEGPTQSIAARWCGGEMFGSVEYEWPLLPNCYRIDAAPRTDAKRQSLKRTLVRRDGRT
jgi:hypothetical protein